MTQEAYCSSRVAKLLKEKGFNIPVWTRYDNEEDKEVIFGDKYDWNNSPMGQISAPTQAMAMAWLRKEHGIFIAINNDDLDFNWQCYDLIDRDDALDPRTLSDSYAGFKTYEEAVEAALMYTLEKLI